MRPEGKSSQGWGRPLPSSKKTTRRAQSAGNRENKKGGILEKRDREGKTAGYYSAVRREKLKNKQEDSVRMVSYDLIRKNRLSARCGSERSTVHQVGRFHNKF